MNNKTAFDLLKEELSLTAIVLEILNKEQVELSEMQFQNIVSTSERKEAAIETLTEITAARHAMMQLNGFELTEVGARAWLESVAQNGQAPHIALLETWQHLLVTAREAKEQNRINGILINKHAVRIQSALHTLRGTSNSAGTYGPNGQASNYTAPRTLVIG